MRWILATDYQDLHSLQQKIQQLENMLVKKNEKESLTNENELIDDIIQSMKEIIQKESEDPIQYKHNILQSQKKSVSQ